MRKIIYLLTIISFLAFIQSENLGFFVPEGWAKSTYDFSKNPLSQSKIELGRTLFYDPILSRDNMVSCASCHLPQLAFAHIDHQLSHGINDRIGTRNAPALMNLAWSKTFMWDGAIRHLDMQSLAPITNHDEMDETLENVVSKLQKSKKYPTLFHKAFGDSIVTGEHLLKSMSQFMLTLVSANSKYDKVQQKRANFNEYEAKGYVLFKKNCNKCHTEPLFTNHDFENNGIGLDPTLNDGGRIKVTKNPSDSLTFKVPTLRNIEVSYPYMHDGRFPNLEMVLFHYSENIQISPTLSPHLVKKIKLSEQEKGQLIAFLKTLNDEDFLQNPDFQYKR